MTEMDIGKGEVMTEVDTGKGRGHDRGGHREGEGYC